MMFAEISNFVSDKNKHDMNAATTEAVELLKQLIAIPSQSRNESAAADKIADFIGSKSLDVRRCGNNVYSLSPDFNDEKPTLLLDAHIDTVKVANGWNHDPYEPVIEDGKLYGLGSNDDGGSLVSLLEAYMAVRETKLPYNIVFSASAEEEVSGRGGVELALKEFPRIDAGIIGEPTGLQPAVAEKGLMVIDFTAHGKAGHAARNEGINAIYKAVRDIETIENLSFHRHSEHLGDSKATVTIVNAGTQHNVIPAECSFTVDVRSNEMYSNQELFEIISNAVESEAKARSFRLNSSRISPTHPLVKRVEAMGKKPFGSPTLSNQALMSFPTIKIGPGESSRSHTADEFIKIAEISEAIDFYVKFLSGLQL